MLDAAKRNLFAAQHAGVDAYHAVFQRLAHTGDAAHVAAVEITGQPVFGGICGGDGFFFGVKTENGRQRAERFLPGAAHGGGGIRHQCGRKKSFTQRLAARQQASAMGQGVFHMEAHLFHGGAVD